MITLTPAYGRDYKTKSGAQKDFDTGKDFILNSLDAPQKLVNKKQLADEGVTEVKLRFAGQTKAVIVEVT